MVKSIRVSDFPFVRNRASRWLGPIPVPRQRNDRVLDTIRDIRIPMAHSERHDRVLDTIRLIRTARAASLRRRVLSLEAQLRAVDLAAVKLATRRSLAAVAEAAHQDVAEALALEEDELPALVDGSSSDEDEPVLVDASPGKPDFSLVIVDEVSCARRQDVMAMAFALRNLETQSRGNLHAHPRMDVPHGIFYVAHSRVKNSSSPPPPSP